MRPEKPAEPEAPEAAGTPADSSEPLKPEISAEPPETKTTVEPEITAEPEKPAEQEAVVQRPDSRIPPEARRMAAAPYGIAGTGIKRPDAESQATGLVRPTRSGEDRRPPRPRNGAPEGKRTEGSEEPPRVRVHVGYAPGRMKEQQVSDEMTRQVPTAETMKQLPAGNANARAYLEKRNNPFRQEESSGKTPNLSGHKALRAVVILLLLAGFALMGWMLFKGRNGNDPVISRETPQVISFEPPNTEGLISPQELVFSAATGKDVSGIRLRGEGDADLDTVVIYGDNAESRVWTMKMPVETGFHGTVTLQVRRSGEEEWFDTEYKAELNVKNQLGEDVQSQPLPEEDDDYYNPDEVKTNTPADTVTQIPPEQAEAKPDGEAKQEPEGQPEEDRGGQPEENPDKGPETEKDTEEGEEDLPMGELKIPETTGTPAPPTPEPTPTPALEAEAAPEAVPDLITNTTVWTSNTKKVKEYNRPAKELIRMPAADDYTNKRLGVMTFRGDNFRRNAAAGTLSAAPKRLDVLWKTEGGSAKGTNQTYYGYQWTGQPVIARWSTEVRAHSNITESKIEKSALKEVIIAGMDGWIRFLDLEDGKITRNSIKLGYPFKGTPSLHPRGYPYMAVGQFARKMKGRTGRIGLRQYNLFTQTEQKLIDGLDGKYHRPENDIGSFETSALIDRVSDTLIAVGTNGMLYLHALNTTFDYNLGVMSTAPSTTVMTNKVKGRKDKALLAVESSPAVYDRYVFYADMGGVLRCVDTNSLQPVWAVNTGDSVMAAVALDLTKERKLNLYTANMLNNRKKGNSDIQIRRYNALSGREEWCMNVGVYKGKKDKQDVGAKASPLIGQNGLENLVFYTVTGLSDDGRAQLKLHDEETSALIALDKETGKLVWAFGMASRSESSPIAMYDEAGSGWIVQCEQDGIMHLLEGLTGREISNLDLEAQIEASPAAYNNVVVIGTTGKGTAGIYGIKVVLDKEEATPAPREEDPAAETAGVAENESGTEEGRTPGEEGEWADGEDQWVEEDLPEESEGGDEEVPGGA